MKIFCKKKTENNELNRLFVGAKKKIENNFLLMIEFAKFLFKLIRNSNIMSSYLCKAF